MNKVVRLVLSRIALFIFVVSVGVCVSAPVYAKDLSGSTIQLYGVKAVFDNVAVHVPKGTTSADAVVNIRDIGRISTVNDIPSLKKGHADLSSVYTFQISSNIRKQSVVEVVVDPVNIKQETNRWTAFFRTSKKDWVALPTIVNKKTNTVRFQLPEGAGQIVIGYHKNVVQGPEKKFSFSSYSGPQYSPAATVQDYESGVFLYRKNPNQVRSIASISKLVTVYTFLQKNDDLSRTVKYSSSAARIGASLPLRGGDELTARQAVLGALIPSANNQTVSLMHNSGLSERDFIRRMNNYAKEMGATKTSFVEPTGLNIQNQSTADNVSRIARVVFRAYPDLFFQAANTPVYSYETSNTHRAMTLYTTNKFDGRGRFEVFGFKTGYLPGSANRTLVMLIKEKSTGRKVIVTLLGNPQYNTIFDEAYALASWSFDEWEFPNAASF